ncbi:YfjI family protein [Clostridium sp. FS41]|uniref:YfjI family protein n=1 Tax=Clostridium sp. FS41 TaxID=1609975 RepID=UPI00061E51D8|nr:YfjI family protein [Clostridium sp. FS41]KJJ71703.1 hypothetical protein CLFS41_23650 [Clostridium sp. FS41]
MDMAGAAVITVVSMAVQTKYAICPIKGWIEPLNLYMVVVARPSERKSPVMREVMAVVYRYTNEYNEKNQQLIEEYNTEKDVLLKKISNMKQELASVKKSKKTVTMEDLKALQNEYDELEEVTPLRLIADDITPEALVSLMYENGGKMAIVSTEGGIFDMAAGRYSDKTNIDVFLKAYSGDMIMVDRKGRSSECIPDPALTILLTVQPSVIEEIMNNKEMSGRGFVARFLYALPVSRIGRRSYRVKPIPEKVKADFDDLICRLLDIPDIGEPRVLHLSREADKLAEDFFHEIETGLTEDLEEIEGWAGKLHGQTMRIAGVFHCCEHVENAYNVPVSGETMKNAIGMGRYFLEHAKAAFAIMGLSDPPEVKDAKYILKRLDESGLHEISKRDLFDSCKGRTGMERVEGMEPGLNELIQRGYIRLFKAEPESQKSQNSQNSQKRRGRPSWMIEVNPVYEALRDGKKPETVQEPEDAEGDDPYGWNAPEDDPCGLTETVKPWTAGEF